MSVQRVNEWARRNPVKATVLTAIWLFVATFAFGSWVLDQSAPRAAAFAATYALVFALLTAAANAYRVRKSSDRR
jgi:hypothetical protein